MAGTMNKVQLIGFLGDDVKMHHFEGGNCLGRFPMATDESYKKKDTGEVVTQTEWHNCIVRNKGAEICEKYIKKGSKIYVEGKIKTRKWQDDKGQDRYSTEIEVKDFIFLDSKGDQSTNNPNPSKPGRERSEVDKYQNAQQSGGGEEFDDLPF